MESGANPDGPRPFLYERRPPWLVGVEPDPGELSERWLQIVAYVADHANESGFFAETSDCWTRRSGLGPRQTGELVARLLALGALERNYGYLYVADWRDRYRLPDARP